MESLDNQPYLVSRDCTFMPSEFGAKTYSRSWQLPPRCRREASSRSACWEGRASSAARLVCSGKSGCSSGGAGSSRHGDSAGSPCADLESAVLLASCYLGFQGFCDLSVNLWKAPFSLPTRTFETFLNCVRLKYVHLNVLSLFRSLLRRHLHAHLHTYLCCNLRHQSLRRRTSPG